MGTERQFRLRAFGWIALILAATFVATQFIWPELTNPPSTSDLQAPAEVKQILQTACYNCHSNETKLSWFDWPVPAYGMVVKDAREGREHLNFLEIVGKLPEGQQRAILFEAVSHIVLGAMPLPAYKRAHPEPVITAEQLAVLKKYLQPAAPKIAPAADISASDAQFDKWI
jgi:hypothetical protein